LFFLLTAGRTALRAAYAPLVAGLIPLVVPDKRHLQYAFTLWGWARNVVTIIGGILGGAVAALIDFRACFIIDAVAFYLSALVLWFGMTGEYNVSRKKKGNIATSENPIEHAVIEREDDGVIGSRCCLIEKIRGACGRQKEIWVYLSGCGFGLIVLMKASTGILSSASGIASAQYSTVYNEDGSVDQDLTSLYLGIESSVRGVGGLLGPAIMNQVTDAAKPHTLQRTAWIGIVIMTLSGYLIASNSIFGVFLLGTFFRNLGRAIMWNYSTLVTQTLSEKSILGRILGTDFTLFGIVNTFGFLILGYLINDVGLTKNQVMLVGATAGGVAAVFWGIYHFRSRGAASPRFNISSNPDETAPMSNSARTMEEGRSESGQDSKPIIGKTLGAGSY